MYVCQGAFIQAMARPLRIVRPSIDQTIAPVYKERQWCDDDRAISRPKKTEQAEEESLYMYTCCSSVYFFNVILPLLRLRPERAVKPRTTAHQAKQQKETQCPSTTKLCISHIWAGEGSACAGGGGWGGRFVLACKVASLAHPAAAPKISGSFAEKTGPSRHTNT